MYGSRHVFQPVCTTKLSLSGGIMLNVQEVLYGFRFRIQGKPRRCGSEGVSAGTTFCFLGVRGDCGGCGGATGGGVALPGHRWATPDGQTGGGVCRACATDTGAYSPCGCVCVVEPVCAVAEVWRQATDVAGLLCSRSMDWGDGLCHEQICGWRMAGAKRGAGVQ